MMDFMAKSFGYKTKVYYEDTDAGGIVYYANYLKYFERARTELIYSLGFNHQKLNETDTYIVVRTCNIKYEKTS
jgi:acyl-CoA thioester hydrolase